MSGASIESPAGGAETVGSPSAVIRHTPLARANPLVLLAVGLLALPASVALRDVGPALVATAVVVALAVVLVPGVTRMPWRLVGPGVGAVTVAWSTWWLGGRDEALALTAGLRIVVLSLPGVLLAPLVDPARLGDQLAQRLRLPARPVSATTTALLRLDALADVWRQAARARRVRGVGPTASPWSRARTMLSLTFVVLVGALRGAGRTADAMDARGFAGAAGRTWAEPAPWTPTDTAVLAGAALLAAAPWAWLLS